VSIDVTTNHLPLDQALAAGWQPCPEHRAATPGDRPANAVALYARAGRIAWLLELDDGRHVLELGAWQAAGVARRRTADLLAEWQQLVAADDMPAFRSAYLAASQADREAVLIAALDRLTDQERAAWADKVRDRLAAMEGRQHG
jgi:hypothetical protein